MAIRLPDPIVGGRGARRLEDHPEGDRVAELERRLESIQRNFDKLAALFPAAPQHLQLAVDQAIATDSGASIALTLSTTYTDIPGCSLTVPQDGSYLVIGTFDFAMTTAGTGILLGRAVIDGSNTGSVAHMTPEQAGSRELVSQTWPTNEVVTSLAAGDTIKLQANKAIAAGVAVVFAFHTKLTVIGPITNS